jgi:hypothetical protein
MAAHDVDRGGTEINVGTEILYKLVCNLKIVLDLQQRLHVVFIFVIRNGILDVKIVDGRCRHDKQQQGNNGQVKYPAKITIFKQLPEFTQPFHREPPS